MQRWQGAGIVLAAVLVLGSCWALSGLLDVTSSAPVALPRPVSTGNVALLPAPVPTLTCVGGSLPLPALTGGPLPSGAPTPPGTPPAPAAFTVVYGCGDRAVAMAPGDTLALKLSGGIEWRLAPPDGAVLRLEKVGDAEQDGVVWLYRAMGPGRLTLNVAGSVTCPPTPAPCPPSPAALRVLVTVR